MSGALSVVTGSVPGLGGLLSAATGVLRVAAFRGVTFDVPDCTHEVGRRLVRFLFPGRDDSLHEDLGRFDGPITVTALLIGDDYVRRQQRLERACAQQGPGTFLHPWLGPLQVVLARPARFKFEDKRLRVCSVELVFEVWQQRQAAQQGTLTGLLDAVDEWVDGAEIMLAGVLAPLGDALGVLGLVDTVLARGAAAWDTVLSRTSSASAAQGAAAVALAALGAGVPVDASGAALVAASAVGLLAAVPAAIADAADRGDDPAVGPGPAAVEAAPVPPRDAATLLLAAVPTFTVLPGEPDPSPHLVLAAQVVAAAEAARAGSLIDYDSRDEAIAWRDRVDAQLAAVGAAAAALAARQPLACAALWRQARAVRAAWAADINERIGRLPATRRIELGATVSAWQIAQAIAGDDPARLVDALLDIVRRNRIRNPALVPAGTIEVLA